MASLPPSAEAATPNTEVEDSSPLPDSKPMVSIICFEVARYRRLQAVRLDLQTDTTVLVGANDSGKTSLMLAIHKFLAHATGHKGASEGFTVYDISANGWSALVDIGREWEADPRTGNSDQALNTKRQAQLECINAIMPSLDVWLHAEDGAWHLVRDLIPTMQWKGGTVGVRLSVQPLSTVGEMDELIKAYLKARELVGTPTHPTGNRTSGRRAWPMDLFDFLRKAPSWFSKVIAYKLNPARLVRPDRFGVAQPQALTNASRPIEDAAVLRRLIRVDFVAAQRGFGGEEAASGGVSGPRPTGGMLTSQLIDYAQRLLGSDVGAMGTLEPDQRVAVSEALESAYGFLDQVVTTVLKDRLDEVRQLGYPGTGDLQELILRAEVHPAAALRHRSALQYQAAGAKPDTHPLPEHAIGLGYQNLLSLSFALMQFRDSRVQPPKTDEQREVEAPAAVHLVLIEEPEAHLHVQVQRTFILRARDRLMPKGHPELATQLVVSTHSSHLAHAVDFANLRYLKRRARNTTQPLPTSVVVSLAEVFGSGDQASEDTLRFVQRYVRLQHNDLLFADGIVLVEGTAERILVPAFMERNHERLRARYLSLVEVGGSHAHRLRPLLEHLGLPVLLLTDLDPVKSSTSEKNGKKRVVKKKVPTRLQDGQISANPSIKALLRCDSIDELCGLTEEQKLVSVTGGDEPFLRVAFQVPGLPSCPCASTLEDALILENYKWFAALPEPDERFLKHVCELVTEAAGPNQDLAEKLHHMMSTGDLDKGAFALEVFMRLNDRVEGVGLACPRYVRQGLEWLADQLDKLEVSLSGAQA